jgi:hypothetical protein
MISLGGVVFAERGEAQIDWVDQHLWQPVGQTIRYALAGNPVVQENPRSGRPIVLTAELPWAWLTSATVEALNVLAATPQNLVLVYNTLTTTVRFNRSQGPLVVTPVTPLREYYTGSIFLIEVI